MVRSIGAREAEGLIAQGGVDIVDVREPHEWATGHLPGARLVPLGRLRADPDDARLGAKVLFVCERGGRSTQAAQLASSRGVAEVFSLDGGTSGWRSAGLPIVIPETPVRIEYHLSAKGRDLDGVMDAIAEWSARWIALTPDETEAEARVLEVENSAALVP